MHPSTAVTAFENRAQVGVERTIDVTALLCPMTYVHVRLALDRLQSGQVLRVHLRGDASRNVPANASAQGHVIVGADADDEGVTTILIRRG